jgi:arylsulfatase A-like enzyme
MSGHSATKTAQTAETGSTFWRRTLRLVLFGVLVSYLFALFFYLRSLLFEPGSAIDVDTLGSGGHAHLLFYFGAATYIPLIGAVCALVVGALAAWLLPLIRRLSEGRRRFIGFGSVALVNAVVLALPNYAAQYARWDTWVTIIGGLLIGAGAVWAALKLPRLIRWASRIAGILLGAALPATIILYTTALGGFDYTSPPEDPPGPNVLVIVSDAHRADYTSTYGGPAPTPNLDRLAAMGVRFEYCYSPSNWTLPSVSSLFTGLEPAVHGVGVTKPLPPVETLQEKLNDAGYTTWGLFCNGVITTHSGHYRGFDSYANWMYHTTAKLGNLNVWVPEYNAPLYLALLHRLSLWLTAADLRRLKTIPNETAVELAGELPPEGGVYAYVHLFDPHFPYTPPLRYVPDNDYSGPYEDSSGLNYVSERREAGVGGAPAAEREQIRALYAAEVRYADEVLGRMLDALEAGGALENTVVFYTGDHGEAFWEHGDIGHTTSVYDEQIRVPLVVWWPGLFEGGAIRSDHTSLTDLHPTILTGLGLGYNEDSTLARPLQNPPAEERYIYAENIGFMGREGTVVSDEGRLIIENMDAEPLVELYLPTDTDQRYDVAALYPELRTELLEVWNAYQRRCGYLLERYNPHYAAGRTDDLSEAERDQLRSIGYMQ